MVEDLLKQYKKARKWGDRDRIAEKIFDMTTKGAEDLVEPIVQALKKEKEWMVRKTLRSILARIGTDNAVNVIKETINDKSDNVAYQTIFTLENMNTPAAYNAIKDIIFLSKNPKYRKDAFLTLDRCDRHHNFKTPNFFINALKEIVINVTDTDLGKNIIDNISFRWSSSKNQEYMDIIDNAAKNQKNKIIRNYAKAKIESIGYDKETYERGYTLSPEGKLTILKLKENNLDNLNIEGKESTVLKLEISNIKEIVQSKGLERFQNLEDLSIINTNLSEMSNISELQKLKSLNLSRNKIEKIEGLNQLIALERLNLSNNQITEVKGIEKLIYLKYLNLENNSLSPPVGVLEGDNVTKFVTNLTGTKVESIEKKSIVTPFHDAILRFNVEDKCLYCKKKVIENHQSACEEKLLEMIRAKNNKIPTEVTYKVMIKASETIKVVGYKKTPNAYSSFETRTITIPAKYEKRKKKFFKKISGKFNSLAGTVCKNCSEKFLSEAKKKMKVVKTRGTIEKITKSVDEAIKNLNNLIKPWIEKVEQ